MSHLDKVYHMIDQRILQDCFGDVLREARLRASLSQEALAMECELDRTFISMLERGQRQPSLSTIFALSDALGIRPSTLLKKVETATE